MITPPGSFFQQFVLMLFFLCSFFPLIIQASSLKLEWLTSAISLLENTLKERSRQMEIQAKESDGLRKELRRKDAIINEYNAILKRSNDTEDRELERLRRELGKLRHTIIDNNLVIREYENKIEQLQNKNEKLMSVIRPPGIAISGIPRSRAQGVSASPMVYNTDILHRYAKNSR